MEMVHVAFANQAKRLWRASGIAERLKRQRLQRLDRLADGGLTRPGSRVVEVGCSTGEDYIRFAAERGVHVTGVDMREVELPYANTTFVQANASKLPFDDQQFDVALSIGVLEHIQPIEELAASVSEIARVAKRFVVVVPAISTLIEPHVGQVLYGLRKHSAKRVPWWGLNFFSDEAWLQFRGFQGAEIDRFAYVPLLITNTVIWGQPTADQSVTVGTA